MGPENGCECGAPNEVRVKAGCPRRAANRSDASFAAARCRHCFRTSRLKLYNCYDPRALLSAAQSLLGTVTRTDITVLQSYRDQLTTRLRELSENERFIKLTTMHKALAALSDDFGCFPQEINHMFLVTVPGLQRMLNICATTPRRRRRRISRQRERMRRSTGHMWR